MSAEMPDQDDRRDDDRDRPLLGLVMIVRNEAPRIAEVLATYRPHVDAWTILDTGSTDGTQDVVLAALSGIPGNLHEEPFVDFATSRNRALELHAAATTFAIMPNGDLLLGGATLRQFLAGRRDDGAAGAYRVRISPGHYNLPLVTRFDGGWRYQGRTHECAVGPRLGDVIPGVSLHRDRSARTEAGWRSRWERDLQLLRADLADDPSSARSCFYLGQTLECLGRPGEALDYYRRRATMGGYFDEAYEARFRAARLLAQLGRPWAEVQQGYLEAHAHDPRRAEPLHAVAEHWHDAGQHALSRIFAVAAADLPRPQTDLFLDEEVYEWRAADLAAVASYYVGRREEGRRHAAWAAAHRPDDARLRANLAFYARGAAELLGAEARSVDFVPEAGWCATNPSICEHRGRLRCVVRTVNYALEGGRYASPDDVARTRNFLLDLGEDLATTAAAEMVDLSGLPRSSFPVRGFEDARLFAWRGGWWAVAAARDLAEDGHCDVVLLEVGADAAIHRATPLRGAWSRIHQKNWYPLVDEAMDEVRLVQSTELGRYVALAGSAGPDPAVDARRALLEEDPGRLRGGSQAVRVDGGWLAVVHEVYHPRDSERIYLHRFVLLSEELALVAMTEPFYFEQRGVEFCAGLARVGSRLIASYGVGDARARLAVVEWEAVRRQLHAPDARLD